MIAELSTLCWVIIVEIVLAASEQNLGLLRYVRKIADEGIVDMA